MIRSQSKVRLLRLAVALLWGVTAATAHAADPDALWRIVHGHCVPAEQAGKGPAPCAEVDLSGGYAVLKDIRGATQFLLIPTARVSGVESSEILAPNAPNYWQAAWQARRFVEGKAGKEIARQDLGLAINSAVRRSQNQLHIHIDCLRADVVQSLADQAAHIGDSWSTVTLPPSGHPYQARRINSSDLQGVDPFRIVADTLPGAARDMGDQTIVLAGAAFGQGLDGFYLLVDTASASDPDRGWGEELQDHDCAVLKNP